MLTDGAPWAPDVGASPSPSHLRAGNGGDGKEGLVAKLTWNDAAVPADDPASLIKKLADAAAEVVRNISRLCHDCNVEKISSPDPTPPSVGFVGV